MLLADVAAPVPLARSFTYEVPARLAQGVVPGARVVCELGKRRVVGVVLAVGEREPVAGLEYKPIAAVVDPEPIVGRELLRFLVELGAYYFAPIGEVLRLALPALERGQREDLEAQGALALGDALAGTRSVGGRRVLHAKATDALEAPGSLRGQAQGVLAALRASGGQPAAHLEKTFPNARAALKKLAALGLVALEEREAPRDPYFRDEAPRDAPPELNDAQAAAASRVAEALAATEKDAARAFLLFGVTGSGKTEVYLRAIAACREQGRGALLMVPEIALTPQLVSRFRARFGDDVAVLHSALSEGDRHAMWKRLRRGEVNVAIGARSALFAPVPSLGLVLVDEEHDGSFKQEEGVRYHARDMALLRAHRAGAVCVLGSATPSLEVVNLVKQGKLVELALPDRAVRAAVLPTVTIVDLRRVGAGPTGDKLISLPLHRALEETLAKGEQAIVFLNRRGFAPSVVCEACGTVATCAACSVALTYHRGRRPKVEPAAGPLLEKVTAEARARALAEETSPDPHGRLRCHYCDFATLMPPRCAACSADALVLEGLGTERLEATLAEAFPKARVARLDRDVADGARSQAILDKMRAGKIDVLVGTQMVTKGHDLPAVTLVGVVNADASLSLPDFRAAERGFQLLVQVAGRAGRSDRPGRVIVQTRNPEHHAVRFAARHDVRGFLAHELGDRAEVDYPPFARLALVRIEAVEEADAKSAAARLANAARATPDGAARRVEVLGPAAAPIARLRNRFRFRLLLRARERGPLRAVVAALHATREELPRAVRVVFDVDPVAML